MIMVVLFAQLQNVQSQKYAIKATVFVRQELQQEQIQKLVNVRMDILNAGELVMRLAITALLMKIVVLVLIVFQITIVSEAVMISTLVCVV